MHAGKQNNGQVMSSKLFEIFLEKVSGEKIYADFTDMDKTKQNPNGFGIYDVRNSSVGPFMIDYNILGCQNDDFLRDTMTLRVPELDIDNVCFGPFWPDSKPSKDFIALRNVISNMKIRPSMMSYNEAVDKFMYFHASSIVRQIVARKDVEARVIYDVVNQMISMGLQNARLRMDELGCNITTRLPGGKTETIRFIEYSDPSEKKFDKTYAVIKIPSVDISFMCGGRIPTTRDKMVYDQVKRYADSITSCKSITPGTEEIGRFDVGYRWLMKQVLNARESTKTK